MEKWWWHVPPMLGYSDNRCDTSCSQTFYKQSVTFANIVYPQNAVHVEKMSWSHIETFLKSPLSARIISKAERRSSQLRNTVNQRANEPLNIHSIVHFRVLPWQQACPLSRLQNWWKWASWAECLHMPLCRGRTLTPLRAPACPRRRLRALKSETHWVWWERD